MQERKSLLAMNQLLDHTVEMLALWKVLCDHQLHLLGQSLEFTRIVFCNRPWTPANRFLLASIYPTFVSSYPPVNTTEALWNFRSVD